MPNNPTEKNDGEKAKLMRAALEKFAAAQPARSELWVWAIEGQTFPSVALAMLYDTTKGEC